ncbi:MAG: helix-turn-helix domain-containing protein [Candidatus Binatia bacterium]
MGLFEEHKAERRARILVAARELIAELGYDGLTMRDLAKASRVSVPTLYNLFGGKQALLLGELESTFAAVVAGTEQARTGSVVDRALAICEAGNADLLAAPRYSRELILLFLTSSETAEVRRASAESYAELMADVLRDGQKAGEVQAWVEPLILARRMFAHYQLAMIEWARGEVDTDGFRAATRFGMCAMLLGVTRGKAQRQVTQEMQAVQSTMTSGRRPKTRARKGG